MIVKRSVSDSPYDPEFGTTEAQFYGHRVAEKCSLRTPRVYHCDLDDVTGQSCLILEDLGNHGFVRQIEGCSPEQAMMAIREIARLHARWWGQALPQDLEWIRPPAESPIGRFCRRWIEDYTGEWPGALGEAPDVLRTRFNELASGLAKEPRTIAHGDFHSQNIAFGKQGGRPRVIDFQFIQHASGMVDMARFLATSLQVDVRREIEGDLLGEYEASLRANGVRDYDVSRYLDDLRAAFVWNLASPLTFHVIAVMTRGKAWPQRFPILERCLAAIDDWDALKLSWW